MYVLGVGQVVFGLGRQLVGCSLGMRLGGAGGRGTAQFYHNSENL